MIAATATQFAVLTAPQNAAPGAASNSSAAALSPPPRGDGTKAQPGTDMGTEQPKTEEEKRKAEERPETVSKDSKRGA
jgi:hypothetical protein